MRYLMILLVSTVLPAQLPAQVSAEADLDLAADCAVAEGSPGPMVCAVQAMSACSADAGEVPAIATLCFRNAQTAFGEAISELMDQVTDGMPEELAAVAGIEIKYDLLGGLMQCDRMTELAMVGDAPAADVQLNAEACNATATGATYLRLLMRAQNL